MNIFMVLSLIGGLALFLYGMQMMGDGLKKASGGKLEMILEKLTSNKLMAVLLGAGVTAIIQSSSATTVMVVGFVKFGHYEFIPCGRCYYGRECWYNSYGMDFKYDGDYRSEPVFTIAEAILLLPDSCDRGRGDPDDQQERKAA